MIVAFYWWTAQTCSSVPSVYNTFTLCASAYPFPTRTNTRKCGRASHATNALGCPRPRPSTWYGVQECDRDPKTCKGDECETCAAYNANASPEAFREVVNGRRRYLPKTVEELKKAGATYKSKWFELIREEGYAASQSEHSSPTAKLTSSYLYPQVRRDGLVRRGG